MAEKCLLAATIAVLVCHPSSSVRCFTPKPKDQKSPQEVHKPKPKSKEKLESKYSFSSTNTSPQKHKPKRTSPPKAFNPLARQTPMISEENLKPNSSFSPIKVSEVFRGDPLFGILEKIIRSGWLDKKRLKIKKVLRVSHTVRTLLKFERHRQNLELKFSKSGFHERLAVDGSDMLQFHGATISCSLGAKSNVSSIHVCGEKLCGVCRILSSNFSIEEGSVSFFDKSWEAHKKVIANGVSARKAIIVCRVIAGQIGRCDQHRLMDGDEGGGCDSIVVGSSRVSQSNGGKELFVLEPKAVLPCFVVTYKA